MPLGVRDVMLVIRAQDQATSILRRIGDGFGDLSDKANAAARTQMMQGAALMGMGAGIATIGAGIISVYVDAIGAAADYQQQAALTLTQIDDLGVTLEEV